MWATRISCSEVATSEALVMRVVIVARLVYGLGNRVNEDGEICGIAMFDHVLPSVRKWALKHRVRNNAVAESSC
jgi:hypothetical protein